MLGAGDLFELDKEVERPVLCALIVKWNHQVFPKQSLSGHQMWRTSTLNGQLLHALLVIFPGASGWLLLTE